MRAVWLREFGGPEVLVPGDAEDPVPGEGQALVEVAFVNITFVETQMRAGTGPGAGAAGAARHPRQRSGRHGDGGRRGR
ncbi:hypothetical protein [Actinomadura madurae]|uniref:hypothetical protein n=1 Tax=Actinomadura madurae TaxID=1993 RepID=UPI0020D25586|nr:hypothetical protein [Actinomadura madurae]MCQ0015564.1 hypothetical protein [Actinomadura madurae]